MPNEADHERIEVQATRSAGPIPANGHEWRNRGLLAAAAAGLWISHGIATWSNDPATGTAMLSASLLVVASLGALSVGVSGLVSAAGSRWLHVFCGRRVFVCGALVSTIAVIFVASIVRRDPFQELASSGRITAGEIVDGGVVLAALMCVTGAGMAFLGAWDAYRHDHVAGLAGGDRAMMIDLLCTVSDRCSDCVQSVGSGRVLSAASTNDANPSRSAELGV